MKEGRTLQGLAVELQRQRSTMRDFKAPTSKLKVMEEYEAGLPPDASNGSPVIDTGRDLFHTNRLFMQQLTEWAGIPKKYADLMQAEAPELFSQNINHWLHAKNETRLVRTMDNTARAFLSHRYRTLDNIDVIESVLPVFADRGINVVSTDVTEKHLWLKAVNERKIFEIKKGDVVQVGVVVSNSEVGLGAVHVDPFIYRLVCLNGAIVADAGLRKFHIGRRLEEFDEAVEVFKDETVLADNRAFFLKLRDVVNASFDETEITDLLRSIEEGTRRRLGDGVFVEGVVEVMAKKHGLNEAEAEGVLRHLIEGGDLTQWGLANAVTAYAYKTVTYERATELEKIGGELMTLPEYEWKELAATVA